MLLKNLGYINFIESRISHQILEFIRLPLWYINNISENLLFVNTGLNTRFYIHKSKKPKKSNSNTFRFEAPKNKLKHQETFFSAYPAACFSLRKTTPAGIKTPLTQRSRDASGCNKYLVVREWWHKVGTRAVYLGSSIWYVSLTLQRYTNADLKISQYPLIHIKTKPSMFRILNPKDSRVIHPWSLYFS